MVVKCSACKHKGLSLDPKKPPKRQVGWHEPVLDGGVAIHGSLKLPVQPVAESVNFRVNPRALLKTKRWRMIVSGTGHGPWASTQLHEHASLLLTSTHKHICWRAVKIIFLSFPKTSYL